MARGPMKVLFVWCLLVAIKVCICDETVEDIDGVKVEAAEDEAKDEKVEEDLDNSFTYVDPENEDLKNKLLDDCLNRLDEANDVIDVLKKETKAAIEESKEYQEKIDQLQTDMKKNNKAMYDNYMDQLDSKIEKLKKTLSSEKEPEDEDKNSKLEEYSTKIQEQEKEIETLKSNLKAQEKSLKLQTDLITNQGKTIKSFQTARTVGYEHFEAELKICNKNATALSDKIQELESTVSKQKQRIADMKKRLETQNVQLDAQNGFTLNLDDKIDSLVEKVDELESAMNSYQKVCSDYVQGLELEKGPTGTYYFHNNIRNNKTWHEAQDYCREHGMELVSIESEQENKWIAQKIKEKTGGSSMYWYGLNSLGDQYEWVWAGTGTKAEYKSWKPNVSVSAPLQRCVSSDRQPWFWNIQFCVKHGFFVCEMHRPCSDILKKVQDGE